jgi:hypothetical protein
VDIRFVDIRFAGTLFVDIRSAATLFADTLSEKAARIAPPSSLATTIRGCTAREELGKAQSDALGSVLGVSWLLFHAEYRFAPPRVLAHRRTATDTEFASAADADFPALQVVKSHPKSDSVSLGKASTRSSARKPGYLTFPVVELRVSVA